MAYRLKLKEPLHAGFHRIAAEQLDKVLPGPEALGGNEKWVHETRRALKRTRALLRLVRSSLEPQVYLDENEALREIGRNLSPLRDRDVVAATLAKLEPNASRSLASAITWMKSTIQPNIADSANVALEDQASGVVVDALEALTHCRERLTELDLRGDRLEVLSEGLANSQRAGRKALRMLAEEDTEEALHSVRKRVQTYQRQMALLIAAWPELQHVRVEAAKQVARQLGEAQDLAVLAATVTGNATTQRRRAQAGLLVAACRERQRLCRDEAIPKAERLFALSPDAVGVEFGRLWSASLNVVPPQPKPATEVAAAPPTRRKSA